MKVKGYCPYCEAWRAFTLEAIKRDIREVFSFSSPPAYVGGLVHHFGTCSRGHSGLFTIWRPLAARSYRRDPKKQHYEFGRGVGAAVLYLAHRDSFRRPLQETHFMTGHECGPNCPEYEWPDDYPVGETWW